MPISACGVNNPF
uniref:Uncharacterized protein n=1 Tax=Rhizophora mucronata TaxID=61149 RepID=A0A2P2M855_RHIMU